jgi:hypothetical protein
MKEKEENLRLVADDDWCLSTKPQVKEREYCYVGVLCVCVGCMYIRWIHHEVENNPRRRNRKGKKGRKDPTPFCYVLFHLSFLT